MESSLSKSESSPSRNVGDFGASSCTSFSPGCFKMGEVSTAAALVFDARKPLPPLLPWGCGRPAKSGFLLTLGGGLSELWSPALSPIPGSPNLLAASFSQLVSLLHNSSTLLDTRRQYGAAICQSGQTSLFPPFPLRSVGVGWEMAAATASGSATPVRRLRIPCHLDPSPTETPYR